MSGYVSSIKRYMRHDGPGIRTTVFLKGCPLRCIWCSSPQTWKVQPEAVFLQSKCIGCGKCLKACKYGAIKMNPGEHRIDYKKCVSCGSCARVCPSQAIRMDGQEMTHEEVVAIVERDKSYYRSTGGGITISGGEVTMQPDFAIDILKLCHERGIHRCIETCGYCEWETLERILKEVDIVYIDLKHLDEGIHKKLTGLSNAKILDNIRKAAASKLCRVVLNIPAIPGCNADKENLKALADFMHECGLTDLRYLEFHKLGQHEYEELGMEYAVKDIESLTPEQNEENQEFLRSMGIRIVND